MCLVQALGIRLASAAGRQATTDAGVREAARITMSGVAAGRDVARFCWLAESHMGRLICQLDDEVWGRSAVLTGTHRSTVASLRGSSAWACDAASAATGHESHRLRQLALCMNTQRI
jgi:hypothetical protein